MKYAFEIVLGGMIYKVVQIWPGLVGLVYTQISPGHIWITLYLPVFMTTGCGIQEILRLLPPQFERLQYWYYWPGGGGGGGFF
jgi:hypothetical protein